jgi:putative ABC transport system permease protein
VETFDLKMVQGRDFSEEYQTDASEACVVNQSLVRYMGMENPIGKRVTLAGEPKRIIGVVKNFNHQPLIFEITPLVMAIRPSWYFDLIIKISPENIPGSLAHIENTYKSATPYFPFEYTFLDEEFNSIYRPLDKMSTIFNSFAVLAVFISCLGLFGLASLVLEQKRKEIGIRKVMGASLPGIVFLLSRRFLKIVLISNLVALPLAYVGSKFFLNLFTSRAPLTTIVFLVTAIFSFAVALLTVGFQVIKTALSDPVDSIRYE